MHRFAAILFAAILAPAFPAGAAPVIHAVVSFSILADMAANVGGDRVAIRTLVGPDGDAHVYEPTPGDAEAIAKADIVILNGLGLESWSARLIAASGYHGPVVEAAAAVSPLRMLPQGSAERSAAGGPVVDPHAFQSLVNAATYVSAIRDGLCATDPANCPAYRANADAYLGKIAALDAHVRAEIASVPGSRRRIITNHDAFGYFGAAYGVEFIAPQGLDTDVEATAGDVAAIIRQIRVSKISALFLENISDPRLIQQIGRDTGVMLGGELHSDALAKSGPASTYLGMMANNVDLMVKAMGGTP